MTLRALPLAAQMKLLITSEKNQGENWPAEPDAAANESAESRRVNKLEKLLL